MDFRLPAQGAALQVDADIASALADLRDVWQRTIIQRLFKSTYTAVGSAGKSLPVADGGTADSTYIPRTAPTAPLRLPTRTRTCCGWTASPRPTWRRPLRTCGNTAMMARTICWLRKLTWVRGATRPMSPAGSSALMG